MLYEFPMSPIPATCSAHFVLLDLIILTSYKLEGHHLAITEGLFTVHANTSG
jgi:hypothetical protein